MEVVAGMPVSAVIAAASARSRSMPSHEPEVPFHAMTSTLASASCRAAASIGPGSNWASLSPSRAIRVTGTRAKWAVAAFVPCRRA